MKKIALHSAKKVFNVHADKYQQQYMNVERYAASLNTFCDQVAGPAPAILDIGCGPGNLSQFVLKQLPGSSLVGIDIAPNMVSLAAANNPTATFCEMDCRQLSSIQKKFDGILCGFLLPYLDEAEVDELLKNCDRLLKAGAILLISTMENDPSLSGWHTNSSGEQLYIYYRLADALKAMLHHYGMETILTNRLPGIGTQAENNKDLVILARKAI